MAIKQKLRKKIMGLAIFYGLILAGALIFYYYTSNPYEEIKFEITDFQYSSDTGKGYEMIAKDGKTYSIAPEQRKNFAASDFFSETAYEDEVKVYVKRGEKTEDDSTAVYGVECNGRVYLEFVPPTSNGWILLVGFGIIIFITIGMKFIQLSKVKKNEYLWKKRQYIIALCNKKGDILFVPCSTTSYLYPNVDMMDRYYEVTKDDAEETLEEAMNFCYNSLANPSRLEAHLKQIYGARDLKEFLKYKKILYVVHDANDGYFIRKMKSILPAPEENVYEIVTEGRHLSKDCSKSELIASIVEESL